MPREAVLGMICILVGGSRSCNNLLRLSTSAFHRRLSRWPSNGERHRGRYDLLTILVVLVIKIMRGAPYTLQIRFYPVKLCLPAWALIMVASIRVGSGDSMCKQLGRSASFRSEINLIDHILCSYQIMC